MRICATEVRTRREQVLYTPGILLGAQGSTSTKHAPPRGSADSNAACGGPQQHPVNPFSSLSEKQLREE